MNRCFQALSLVLAFLLSSFAYGQTSVACGPKGYTVVFINGLRVSPTDAAINAAGLRTLVGRNQQFGRPVQYALAYNLTRGTLEDFTEAAVQKAAELGVPPAAALETFLTTTTGPNISVLSTPTQNSIFAWAIGDEEERTQKLREAAASGSADLTSIVNTINSLTTGAGVLLVGHSQGNFFMNAAYRQLTTGVNPRAPSEVLAYGVAVPANSIAGTLATPNYVTSSTDLIMERVRTTLGALPSTTPDGPSEETRFRNATDNSFGHDFNLIYINPIYPFADQIRTAALRALNTLQIPVPSSAVVNTCTLKIAVNGSAPLGWTNPGVTTMSDFFAVNRSLYNGTTGNSCGGEVGSPVYSKDARISPTAAFYEARTVVNAPYLNFPNRRPCSSFVAIQYIPDPSGDITSPLRPRIWANAAASGEKFIGTSSSRFENQLRFDSGDPWNPNPLVSPGYQCLVGYVPNLSASFTSSWVPASCTASLEIK
jgi:hypothetical protein